MIMNSESHTAKVIDMADLFIPDAFYTSAQDFALRALEAHHSGDHRCVSLRRNGRGTPGKGMPGPAITRAAD